jgi:hypothetical protein
MVPYHVSGHNISGHLLEVTHHRLNYGLKSVTTSKMRQKCVRRASESDRNASDLRRKASDHKIQEIFLELNKLFNYV